MAHRDPRFLGELKRRRVDRAAAVYVVVGLAVIEAANNILPLPGFRVRKNVEESGPHGNAGE